jgi:hypothetical protein
MCQRALAFLVCFAFAVVCGAAPTLSAGDRARLLEQGAFHMLSGPAPLPGEAIRFCADANGRFAMPGARWAATDVASAGGTLPGRRLIWAASSEDLFVIHFEQGGFAHTYHVVVLRFLHGATAYDLAWRASSPRLKDYANFVRVLQANELQDEPAFAR